VKSPDLANNRNNHQLYLRNLKQLDLRENGRLVLQAEGLSGIRWLGADQLLVRIETRGEAESSQSEIDIVHVQTGARERLALPDGTSNYSTSADGNTVVYSTRLKEGSSPGELAERKNRELQGYRVPYGKGSGDNGHVENKFEVYLANRIANGKIYTRKLYFHDSESSEPRSWLRSVGKLDLSPDGKHLLLCRTVEKLPVSWEGQPLIKQLRGFGTPAYSTVLSLYEIASRQLSLAFNAPAGYCQTSWSGDSQAYSVVASSPFGTAEGTEEAASAVAFGNVFFYLFRFNHIFVVDVTTGRCARAIRRDTGEPGNPIFIHDAPMSWEKHDGEMIVRANRRDFVRLRLENGEWKEINRFKTQLGGQAVSSTASDGRVLVGISQAPMTPPNLFVQDLRAHQEILLTDLNPEYQQIQLGQVETIEWTNHFGSKAIGHLIKPVGYEPGKRYPLVFLGTDSGDQFLSDAYPATTAYPPQLLANSGFLVILSHYPRDNKIPANQYPGDMAAAFNWMAMVEGAVDFLADRGLAERDQVGLAGFSRTSWLTNFTITHSTYKFVAASSSDSSLYSYTGYYKYNIQSQTNGDENQVGGPPYGPTLKNWLDYAAPFNAAHVQAAVLMEFTGPIEDAYEFFITLAGQGKPVELYDYPKGSHPLDTPLERLASLQRNVDWFRFWMQGYERLNPEDVDQYVRWHTMQAQQQGKQKGAGLQ
jgi:dipeptidyl aminopeptidase/acylaminoacyl peptidase